MHQALRAVIARRAGTRLAALAAATVLLGATFAVTGTADPLTGEDRLATAERPCGTLQELRLPNGKVACTHGSDPPPGNVDYRKPAPLVVPGQPRGLILPDAGPEGGGPTPVVPGIGCFGDGSDGPRVHVLYGVPAGATDRFEEVVPSIKVWAAEADAVFQASAHKTGGVRRVRYLTDANCELVVDKIPLTAAGGKLFQGTITELTAAGYDRSDRKYMVFVESTELCGIATYYPADRATDDNPNNGNELYPGSVMRIDSGCWGMLPEGHSVEAHELMHSLGAVMPTAPNATLEGHCDDESDTMCYEDVPLISVMRDVCGKDQESLMDCGGDDYFNTAPAEGNFLATHWNATDNVFLSRTIADPVLSIGDVLADEGDRRKGTVSVPVELSLAPGPDGASIKYATADGTATAPSDYEAASGTLTFPEGEDEALISLTLRGNHLPEEDETFTVVLSEPVGLKLPADTATVTIANDDEPQPQGYWLAAADGGVFTFGASAFAGSTGDTPLNEPVVGMAPAPDGYWLASKDGGVFAFGGAEFLGSSLGQTGGESVVGIAARPGGDGYWLVGATGTVFPHGKAEAYPAGSGLSLAAPVVGIAATPTGKGYWLAASDGTVTAHGDAESFTGPVPAPGATVVAISALPNGEGYWLARSDGTVTAAGDALDLGPVDTGGAAVVGLTATPTGGGYWVVTAVGAVFAAGDAAPLGGTEAVTLNAPVGAIVALPRSDG